MTIPNVSHWEELIDWDRAHDEGQVTHTAIKLTHGRHGGDPYALRNWQGAGKKGIKRAVFMWAVPAEGDPILQVRNFVQFARALGFDPAEDWFAGGDIEEKPALTADFGYAIESEIEQQLQTRAWLYSNPDIILHWLDSRVRRFKLWEGNWTAAPAPMVLQGFELGLWQYTRSGQVAGINGGRPATDLNRLPSSIVAPVPLYRAQVSAPVGLHIRSGPGVTYAILGALTSGEEIDVYDELAAWLRISPMTSSPAWVSSSYTRRLPVT